MQADREMGNEQVASGGGCEQWIYIGKLQTWEKKPFGEHTSEREPSQKRKAFAYWEWLLCPIEMK